MAEVMFRVPDFVDEDGIHYTYIQVIVVSDEDDIRAAAKLAAVLSIRKIGPITARCKLCPMGPWLKWIKQRVPNPVHRKNLREG